MILLSSSNDVLMRGFHSDTSVRETTDVTLEEKVAVHLKFMQSGNIRITISVPTHKNVHSDEQCSYKLIITIEY